MPKRYKPSERIPDTCKKEYIIFVTGSTNWIVGTLIDDPHDEIGFIFEARNYQDDIDYYSLSEIDWWLDPMEMD